MELLNIENIGTCNNYFGDYGVVLSRGERTKLEILLAGNGNLYFSLVNFSDDMTFTIGHDYYQVYLVFDRLYNNIFNGDIFEFRSNTNDLEEERNYYKNLARDIGLIDGNDIIWRCDDYLHEVANFFKIKKGFNSYILEFKKGDTSKSDSNTFFDDKNRISIRLRNSGSYYYPFNAVFMQFFRELIFETLQMHQITVEEYLVLKRVLR